MEIDNRKYCKAEPANLNSLISPSLLKYEDIILANIKQVTCDSIKTYYYIYFWEGDICDHFSSPRSVRLILFQGKGGEIEHRQPGDN